MRCHLLPLSCLAAFITTGTLLSAPPAEPNRALLGKKIPNVRFTDASGGPLALSDLKEKKAIVVAFLSFECPVAKSYLASLAEMARKHGEKDLTIIGVCPCDETPRQIEQLAKEYGVPFRVFKDVGYAATQAFKAEITPEFFLLSGDFVLRYRGRFDDAYAARLKRNAQVTRHDLQAAVDQLLSGQPVRVKATVAIGCPIAQPKQAVASAATTYHRDVAPILQKHCLTCHRPGEIGPFALTTYKQAANWAPDIKSYTHERKMPPWMPTGGVPFKSERKLSDGEIATLAAWVDGGAPEGDPKDAPPPLEYTDGWQLGKPDLILTPDREMTIGATGRDVFRAYVLPTNLAESQFVVGYEVRPGNPRVVHHTLHFLDTTGTARRLLKKEEDRQKPPNEPDHGPGYSSRMGPGFLPQGDVGGWAPGIRPHFFPPGMGYYLPKGSDIVIQVHYHRTGKVETDRPKLGLYFAKSPIKNTIQPLIIPGRLTAIPAGEANHKVTGSIWIDRDCTIYNVTPHMHLLGKKIQVTMTPPGGGKKVIVDIGEWDYNWQEKYFFKEPMAVKAGTQFDVEAYYDNSADNPNNPSNPPKRVRFGEETTNEMCFGFLDATSTDGKIIGFRLSPGGFVIRPPRIMPPTP